MTLASQDWSGLGGPDRALALLNSTLANLPAVQGGAAAYAVGEQYARNGQWHLAREVFLAMVERYPSHPRSADAYRWLMRYHASSEARRRSELGHFLVTTQAEFKARPKSEILTVGAAEAVQSQEKTELADPRSARRWYQGSLELAPRLAAFGPLYAADPAVQFPLAAARRQLGDFDNAQKFYSRFLTLTAPLPNTPPAAPGVAAWREAAGMELWLANRTGTPPKPMGQCRQASLRPFLDGKLDDPCWEGVAPLVLKPAAGDAGKEYPTKARFTYDNEYLYVAVECGHPAGTPVPPAAKRTHDADLRAHDRVSILLDLDRDYQTYFQFQVDERGCVAEDCWGDPSWNPRWFAAVKSEANGWTAEVAIPLKELTGEPVTLGKMWAVNVSRVLPGRGVQAWSLPADVKPRPEGMGILVFSAEPAREKK
jgi:tetratricopeptide (TPR) repeat protein